MARRSIETDPLAELEAELEAELALMRALDRALFDWSRREGVALVDEQARVRLAMRCLADELLDMHQDGIPTGFMGEPFDAASSAPE